MKLENSPDINILRMFWIYSLPAVFAMLVNGLYQVVDGFFIGRYIGAEGLAAINIAWPLIGVVLGVGTLIGMGGGALISLNKGMNDEDNAYITLSTTLIFMFVISAVLTFIYFDTSHYFLWLQGAQGLVEVLANEYMDVFNWFCLFAIGGVALPFIVRNDDGPKFATFLMVLAAMLNIVLDYIFIVNFNWGMAGAAWATGIAQAVSFVLALAYMFSPWAKLRMKRLPCYFSFFALKRILQIGLTSLFMYLYFSFVFAVHNYLFVEYGNFNALSAFAIVGYIGAVYYLMAEGLAGGMQPLVSFFYGAENMLNVRKVFRFASVVTIVLGVVYFVLVNVFALPIIQMFMSENIKELEDFALFGMYAHLIALSLDGFLVIASTFYQSLGFGGRALMVSVGNMLIQLPFLFFLPEVLGLTGVWVALPLSNVLLTGFVVYFLYKDIKKNCPILTS